MAPAQVKDIHTWVQSEGPSILQGAACGEAVAIGKVLQVEVPAQGRHPLLPLTLPPEQM